MNIRNNCLTDEEMAIVSEELSEELADEHARIEQLTQAERN
jgi:hypothetical protein